MKHITEIDLNPKQSSQYSAEEKSYVRAFVGSVFQMFPNYNNELLKDDNFRAQCRMYAKEIIAMPASEYEDRLNKTKRLVSVQNMKGLLGNYRNSVQALAISAGDLEKLNHDYRIAFPSHQSGSGAIEGIKMIDSAASDDDTARAKIDEIKGLLK